MRHHHRDACSDRRDCNRRHALTLGALIVLLLTLVAASGWRIVKQHQVPGPFDPSRQGFCDFHNGVYFPSLAFAQGVSPYGQAYAASFPVERSIPFFSPAALAAHWPFAALPLNIAEPIYFAWMLLLVAAISWLIAKWCINERTVANEQPAADRGLLGSPNSLLSSPFALSLAIAIAIVASRGGQQTLFTGYFTFEIILATLMAVHYSGKRPALSGLALAWVAFKPNFILPIGILLLCRGHWRALVIGATLSIASAAASFAWIMPDGGTQELLAQIQQTQAIHRLDAIERPTNNWTRVDLLAVVAKWTASDPSEVVHLLAMLLVLAPAATIIAYRRLSGRATAEDDSAIGLEGTLIMLTTLIAVYHQVYDCMLVFGGIAALCISQHPSWRTLTNGRRWLLVACLAFPSINYLSSQKLLQAFAIEGPAFQSITSLNALALLLAWLVVARVVARVVGRAVGRVSRPVQTTNP